MKALAYLTGATIGVMIFGALLAFGGIAAGDWFAQHRVDRIKANALENWTGKDAPVIWIDRQGNTFAIMPDRTTGTLEQWHTLQK